MVSADRTGSWSFTFWQLFLGIFAHIVTTTLFLMTRFTKMSVSPTEPLSNTATKFAFKFDKVLTMFWTVLDWYVTTAWTNQLFGFKRSSCSVCFVHGSNTVFPSSEIRFFALEAHEVGVDNHRIFFRLSKVGRSFIFELGITLLKFLEFKSIL